MKPILTHLIHINLGVIIHQRFASLWCIKTFIDIPLEYFVYPAAFSNAQHLGEEEGRLTICTEQNCLQKQRHPFCSSCISSVAIRIVPNDITTLAVVVQEI